MLLPHAFLLAALLVWGCNRIGLTAWRRSAGAHWTERARILFPARISRQLNLFGIPAVLAVLSQYYFPWINGLLVLVVGMLGGLLGCFPMDRELDPGLTWRMWLVQVASGCLLLYYSWLVTLITMSVMPPHFGWPVWVIAGVFLVVYLALQFGWNIRLMRWLGLLRPASPRLQALVDETCARTGIKVNATWELSWAYANAAAMATSRELAFSEKMVAACTDDEIKAICAHELGHISEPRWVVWSRVAGTLVLFPVIFVLPIATECFLPGIPLLVCGTLLIWMLNVRLARAMEKRADRVARESLEEATVYARALERLYQTSQMPAVMPKNRAQVHPHLYDRMLAAGVTPDFPRPAAPAKQIWTSRVTTIVFVLVVIFLLSSAVQF